MKAEELRIGNFITVCNPKDELLEIRTPTIERLNVHHLSDIYFENVDWVYQPIPLTEDWLLKFGFERDDSLIDPPDTVNGNFWPDFIKNGVIISLPYFEFHFNESEEEIEIKYVHQLQNLYFALTGKELEIK